MSTATNVITGTCAYIQFKYALFREDTSQDFTFVGVGIAKGLSSDTLKVVEAAAREFIESLKSWDASFCLPPGLSKRERSSVTRSAQSTVENRLADSFGDVEVCIDTLV